MKERPSEAQVNIKWFECKWTWWKNLNLKLG